MLEKATIMSWKTKPMPAQVARLDYQAKFSAQEFERISAGLIPREMEDKWFIVMDGNVLKFYRSWTGTCIYQVEMEKEDSLYYIRQAIVNRDSTQYSETDNAYDVSLLNFLIRHLLLGQDVHFPTPYISTKNYEALPEGALQHHVAGTASREKKQPRDRDAQLLWEVGVRVLLAGTFLLALVGAFLQAVLPVAIGMSADRGWEFKIPSWAGILMLICILCGLGWELYLAGRDKDKSNKET
jgi:hypothetical protein